MGLSTGKELHVDAHLTNLAINYRPQGFIADLIAPIVSVDKQTNSYPVFSRFEAYAVEDTRRSPGTEAKKITRSVGSAFYKAENYALASDVFIEDQANMDMAYRYELDDGKARWLINKLGVDYEKRVLTLAVASANVSTVCFPNSNWGAAGTGAGDCISQIFQMKEYLKSLTGVDANSILIGWRAHNRLLRNYYARQFIQGTNGGGLVTSERLQGAFEIEKYNVSRAMWHGYNEAQTAGSSLGNPMADEVIVYYAPPAPSRDDPSWMYSFRWQGNGLPAPLTVFRHPYDSRKQVDTIEAGYYQDERVVGADLAIRMNTTVNSGAAGYA